MANQKVYNAPGLELQHLSETLSQWLETRGYETQTLSTPGGLTLQARQTQNWVQRQGVAINVAMVQQGENLQVQVGTGKWAVQAVSGVAAAIIFWPLLALPAYAAYKQKQIIDDTWQFIDNYVSSGGQAATGPSSMPSPQPATASASTAQTPCPSCGKPVPEGAKFCANCGAKLTLTCAECGATLRLDAKFCDNCGAPAVK